MANPAIIADWSATTLTTLAGDTTKAPVKGAPYLDFMHTAYYNAVVSIKGRYTPYGSVPRAPHPASNQAAAAHTVLVHRAVPIGKRDRAVQHDSCALRSRISRTVPGSSRAFG